METMKVNRCKLSAVTTLMAGSMLMAAAVLVPACSKEPSAPAAPEGVERASVAARPAATQPAAAADAVMRVYQVQGMHCQMCADHIQRSLAALPGVTSAKVSFDEKRAYVSVAAQEAPSDAQIQRVVEEAGYKATPATQPSAP
jgi:copper chaperone CopZ